MRTILYILFVPILISGCARNIIYEIVVDETQVSLYNNQGLMVLNKHSLNEFEMHDFLDSLVLSTDVITNLIITHSNANSFFLKNFDSIIVHNLELSEINDSMHVTLLEDYRMIDELNSLQIAGEVVTFSAIYKDHKSLKSFSINAGKIYHAGKILQIECTDEFRISADSILLEKKLVIGKVNSMIYTLSGETNYSVTELNELLTDKINSGIVFLSAHFSTEEIIKNLCENDNCKKIIIPTDLDVEHRSRLLEICTEKIEFK